ncbi:hypothetical protein THAOC_31373, partial [Thalassiosira oceanica]
TLGPRCRGGRPTNPRPGLEEQEGDLAGGSVETRPPLDALSSGRRVDGEEGGGGSQAGAWAAITKET